MKQPRQTDRYRQLVARRRELAQREVEAIVAGYRPDRVILFGSLARGDVADTSDVDLLIIKATAEGRLLDRMEAVLRFTSGALEVEPLVYTPAEVERLLEQRNPLVTTALAEGEVVYDRQ